MKGESLFSKIKSAFAYVLLVEVPPCKSYSSFTACGYEYDCGYEAECLCEDCCAGRDAFNTIGKIDPRTGKKFRWYSS